MTSLPFEPGGYAQTKKKDTQKKQQKEQPGRPPFTAEDQAVAVVPGIPDARVWGDSDTDFQKVLPTVSGPWLALSGGGADGAFGAGLLIGWSQSGTRPDFAVVTGASIGALIGPYAFLGSVRDEELKSNFTSITAADVFEDKATPESLLDTWPLKRLLEKRVTAEMLKAIAAEHAKGRPWWHHQSRRRAVLWNMGAIATRGDERRCCSATSCSPHPAFPDLPAGCRGSRRTARNSRSCTSTARSRRRSSCAGIHARRR